MPITWHWPKSFSFQVIIFYRYYFSPCTYSCSLFRPCYFFFFFSLACSDHRHILRRKKEIHIYIYIDVLYLIFFYTRIGDHSILRRILSFEDFAKRENFRFDLLSYSKHFINSSQQRASELLFYHFD